MSPELAPITSFTRISAHLSLSAQPDACLSLRYRDLTCSECVDVCPTRTLRITEKGFSLGAECVECGRCVAVCPTGALSAGFDLPDSPGEPGASSRVECCKVPEELCGDDALRVPCTGALGAAQWLQLVVSAGEKAVTLVDRGWCRHCSAGGEAHPAARHVEEATRLLREMGQAPDRIQVETVPLASGLMPRDIPHQTREPALGRRGFLRALVGHAARATEAQNEPEPIGERALPDGRRRILPTARLAILARLRELSGLDATAVPASLFHDVSLGGGCCNLQVCARSCPTTALRAYEDGDTAGLRFDPVLCIGCGLCESSCPEQAIALTHAARSPEHAHAEPAHPTRADAALAGPRTLSVHFQSLCFDCGAAFIPVRADDDAERCPACIKSRELGQSLFADLFQR